jgi:hypothetical protein
MKGPAMPTDYTVEKSDKTCRQCDRSFAAGEAFYSDLVETDEGFVRRDYCVECWESKREEEAFSFWKTAHPADDAKPKVNVNALWEFFLKLPESDNPHKQEMLFILALFLTRRKVLTFESVGVEKGRQMLVFHHSGQDRDFSIPDPDLSEEQIAEATERLKALFETATPTP